MRKIIELLREFWREFQNDWIVSRFINDKLGKDKNG